MLRQAGATVLVIAGAESPAAARRIVAELRNGGPWLRFVRLPSADDRGDAALAAWSEGLMREGLADRARWILGSGETGDPPTATAAAAPGLPRTAGSEPAVRIVELPPAASPAHRAQLLFAALTGPAKDVAVQPVESARMGRGFAGTMRFMLGPLHDSGLAEHRLGDRPLVPLVGWLELFLRAAFPTELVLPLTVTNATVHHPLRLPTDAPYDLKAETEDLGTSLRGGVLNGAGKLLPAERTYFSAEIVPTSEDALPAPQPPRDLGPALPFDYPAERSLVSHGPIYRTIRSVREAPGVLEIEMVAPPPAEFRLAGRPGRLPCALLDGCFFAGNMLIRREYSGLSTLPIGFDRFTLHALPSPGMLCRAILTSRGRERDEFLLDVQVTADDGTPLWSLAGCRRRAATTSRGPTSG